MFIKNGISTFLTGFLSFRPLELRPNLHLSTFISKVFPCFWPLELRPDLHLPTYLSSSCFVLSWFVSSQQQPTSSTFHRVYCNFLDRVLFQFFRSRFMLFPRPLHDTLLTTGFLGVSVIYRQSPFTPPPFPGSCVVHTLQRVFCSLRRVAAMFGLPAFNRLLHRCFMASPAFLAAERLSLRGACVSRAVRDSSHSAFCFCIFCCVCFYFLVFLGLLVLLFPCLPL